MTATYRSAHWQCRQAPRVKHTQVQHSRGWIRHPRGWVRVVELFSPHSTLTSGKSSQVKRGVAQSSAAPARKIQDGIRDDRPWLGLRIRHMDSILLCNLFDTNTPQVQTRADQDSINRLRSQRHASIIQTKAHVMSSKAFDSVSRSL